MQIELLNGGILSDPRSRVVAIEAVTRSICEQAGEDSVDGVMMLLTAAVHLQSQYSTGTPEQNLMVLAAALGHATAAADGFFKLRAISPSSPPTE